MFKGVPLMIVTWKGICWEMRPDVLDILELLLGGLQYHATTYQRPIAQASNFGSRYRIAEGR